ncbi:MAG: hypothetical protein HY996_09575 [Micrococcales bacterium]|nr:hypothetical protein [Micrococcales bacterium]
MRWDRLFDDLEGQLEQELGAEQVDLIAEEERLRVGRLAFRDRLVAMSGSSSSRRELDLVLRDGTPVRIRVASSGRDWIAGDLEGGRVRASCIVPLDAIAAAAPAGDQLAAGLAVDPLGAPAPGDLGARLGLALVLRDLCRRRAAVDLVCGWAVLHGTLDRVGRDHVDLAEHDPGVARREVAVRRIRLVPFAQLLSIRF